MSFTSTKSSLFTASGHTHIDGTKLGLEDLRAFVHTYLRVQYGLHPLLRPTKPGSRCSPPQWQRWLRIARRVAARDSTAWLCEDLVPLQILFNTRHCSIKLLEMLLRNLAEGEGAFRHVSNLHIKRTFLQSGWVEPLVVKLLTEKALADELWGIIEPEGVTIIDPADLVKPVQKCSPSFARDANPDSYQAHTWINREIATWFKSLRSTEFYEVAPALRRLIPAERPAPEDEVLTDVEAMRQALPDCYGGVVRRPSRHDSGAVDPSTKSVLSPSSKHTIQLNVDIPRKQSKALHHKQSIECDCGQGHEINIVTVLEPAVMENFRDRRKSF